MSKATWYVFRCPLVAFLSITVFIVQLSAEDTCESVKEQCEDTPVEKNFGDTSTIFNSENKDGEKLAFHGNAKEPIQFDESSNERIVDGATDQLRGHLMKLGEQSSVIHGEIEDINYVLNGRDFYTHFLRKGRPLVMRGAAVDWSAVKNWANETYMREKYGHVIFDVEFTKHYERIHPIKKTMNLSEYLDIYKSKQVYLDCPFPQTDLTSDIMVPYCLQCDEVMSTITSIHLLYSSGNTSSSLHNDGYQNLLTLISGTKEVLVASSDNGDHLYANNYTTVPGLSPINPESVDLKKFPNVSKVSFHKVRGETYDYKDSMDFYLSMNCYNVNLVAG